MVVGKKGSVVVIVKVVNESLIVRVLISKTSVSETEEDVPILSEEKVSKSGEDITGDCTDVLVEAAEMGATGLKGEEATGNEGSYVSGAEEVCPPTKEVSGTEGNVLTKVEVAEDRSAEAVDSTGLVSLIGVNRDTEVTIEGGRVANVGASVDTVEVTGVRVGEVIRDVGPTTTSEDEIGSSLVVSEVTVERAGLDVS